MTIRTRTAKIDRHVGGMAELFDMDVSLAMSAYRRLQKVEKYAHDMALQACNRADVDLEKVEEDIKWRVTRILGKIPECFFYDTDPRGYSLKMECGIYPRGFYTDMGGYGILAPTFSSEE